MDDLIRAGKVRYIGTSTFAAWQSVEALWVADRLGTNRFVCEQPPYHILDRRIERELLPMARTFSYGIIPWSPLAGGLLTGKYRRGEEPPANSRYTEQSRQTSPRFTDFVFDVVELIEKLIDGKDVTISQFALAWVAGQPGVTSPIIGPRTMEQLEDNLKSLDVALTDGDRDAIDEIVPPGQMRAPFYQADFGPHLYRV